MAGAITVMPKQHTSSRWFHEANERPTWLSCFIVTISTRLKLSRHASSHPPVRRSPAAAPWCTRSHRRSVSDQRVWSRSRKHHPIDSQPSHLRRIEDLASENGRQAAELDALRVRNATLLAPQ